MLKVAGLPWDPPPAKPEPTLPSNVKHQTDRNTNSNNNMNPPSSQANLNTIPPIKPEMSSYPLQPPSQSYPAPQFPPGQALTAQQRAAMNLHQTFGDRAGVQIAELQGSQRHPNMAQQMPQGPYIKQESSQPGLPSMDAYRHNVIHQSSPVIKTDQTDGAGDKRGEWDAEYARRKQAFRQERGESDRLIRDHVFASQQQLEAGGLMMPLAERRHHPQNHIIEAEPSNAAGTSVSRAQGDATGDDDEDEEDENAINSDLDDPEDAADDIEGNESIGNVMLCTYDKVQRVKNK